MIEEVTQNIYKIEIPLPGNPLGNLNSYLIKAEGRFLVIDTGMNCSECLREMQSSLKRLEVDLERTDFFITHMHVDHLGLVEQLASKSSKIYFCHKEASIANHYGSQFEKMWQNFHVLYLSNGFPEGELRTVIDNHPGLKYGLKGRVNFSLVKEGDYILISDFQFRCIETPGHSPGHMCLYEANKKILISGDHILFGITPNLLSWPEMEDSLSNYLASLDKVYFYDVSLVLSGHRKIWYDHRKRINELREHHQHRLHEVLSALEYGKRNAFQVASLISWDINYNRWKSFPPLQKWFAVGETLAHLNYLEQKGLVRRNIQQNNIYFLLT